MEFDVEVDDNLVYDIFYCLVVSVYIFILIVESLLILYLGVFWVIVVNMYSV